MSENPLQRDPTTNNTKLRAGLTVSVGLLIVFVLMRYVWQSPSPTVAGIGALILALLAFAAWARGGWTMWHEWIPSASMSVSVALVGVLVWLNGTGWWDYAFFLAITLWLWPAALTSNGNAVQILPGVLWLVVSVVYAANPTWLDWLMWRVLFPLAAFALVWVAYERYMVSGNRVINRNGNNNRLVGSMDAGRLWQGGRVLGVISTLGLLVLLGALAFTGLRFFVTPSFLYEAPTWAKWVSATGLFLYLPILPYRMYLLLRVLGKETEETKEKFDYRFSHEKEAYPENLPSNSQADPDQYKGFHKNAKKQCVHRRDDEDCWRETLLHHYYCSTQPPIVDDSNKKEYPYYVVMVAMYDEPVAVTKLVNNLARLNYPDDRLEILLLIEEKEIRQSLMGKDPKTNKTGLVAVFIETRKNLLKELYFVVQTVFRLLIYPIIPPKYFVWLHRKLREQTVGDPRRGKVKSDSKLDLQTAQQAFKAIDNLPNGYEARKKCFKILMTPERKGEPQTKPRALNYGLYDMAHKVTEAHYQKIVRIATLPDQSTRQTETKTLLDDIKQDKYKVNCGNGADYCTIYDAEDRPDEEQLRKSVAEFKRQDLLGCTEVKVLQGKLLYENLNDNWLISLFKAEYASWYELLLPALGEQNWVVPLGGTSNHFCYETLKEIGGWDSFNVAEDADLGVWFARQGYQVRMLESVTWELADGELFPWIKQRSRWIKGYIQTYFVHMRSPLRLWYQLDMKEVNPTEIERIQPNKLNMARTMKEVEGFWTWKRFWRFTSFQLIVGASVILPLLNIILWSVTIMYLSSLTALLVFGLDVFSTPLRLVFLLNFYQIIPWATGAFFMGNIIFFIVLMLGHWRHPKPGNYNWVIAWWLFYWLFMSWAAWKALYEYVFDPDYWEKSSHNYL